MKVQVCYIFLFVFLLSCTKDFNTNSDKIQQENALMLNYIQKKGFAYQQTHSGIYIVPDQTPGTGAKPDLNSYVIVNYNGFTLDDKLFDSTDSTLIKRNSLTPLNALYGPLRLSMKVGIPGWTETFATMHEGDTTLAIMPASMATFGDFVPRRYDFILIKVIPNIVEYENQQIADYLKTYNLTPPDSTPKGYYILSKTEGSGKTPVNGNTVAIQYTGKLLNGKIFDQSRENANYSFVVGSNQTFSDIDNAVKNMKVNGKMTILMPFKHENNYSDMLLNDKKQIVIPAYSSLVFDITLMDVK